MAEEYTDAMEYIWERVPKTKEGFIHYLPGDLPYLYRNGFVDARKYTYLQWKAAFEDCKQADGTYLVSHDKFLSLRPYRYVGPAFTPFDPQKVREGEWDDAKLKLLFERSISPSSSVTEDIFWNSIKALKKAGNLQNGNLIVDKKVKTQLAYLIERFPSPRRKLEIEVNKIREEREKEVRNTQKNHDASGFVVGKLASESKMESFKKLEGNTTPQAPQVDSSKPTIDLKSLRKPTKKISG